MKNNLLIIISLFFSLSINVPILANTTFKITIDAGHGGKDPGCIGRNKIKEKDVNLAIALKLGQLIETNHPDVKVIYTRKTDVFIPLIQRTEIANKNKCDLFISIHADAVPTKSANSAYGAGTFTLGTAKTEENLAVAKRENSVILLEENYKTSYQGFDPNSAESYIMFETLQGTHQSQSILLASYIQNQLKNRAKRLDREVRQAPYLVLKTASMPAVLVETGFLSNSNEEKFLASSEGKNRIANAIYHGFRDYKLAFDRHNQATVTSPKNADKKIVRTNNEEVTDSDYTSIEKTQEQIQAKSLEIPKTEKATKTNVSLNANEIIYKIQFLSYYKKLNKGAPQLKGLWPVDYTIEKGTYKYTYGNTINYNEILRTQKQLKSRFKDAFIVRFKNNQRIK